jgi:hypothetical protein
VHSLEPSGGNSHLYLHLEPQRIVILPDCSALLTMVTDCSAMSDYGDVIAGAEASDSLGYLAPELFQNKPPFSPRSLGNYSPRTFASGELSLSKLHQARDIWSLGAVFYMLFTGKPLLDIVNYNNWDSELLSSKLLAIEHVGYRRLLGRMLSHNIMDRPSAREVSECLMYPRSFADDAPQFDVFLSYRVKSDKAVANEVYNLLIQNDVRVWWDQRCILAGSQWENEFCAGIANSYHCICIISSGGIESMKDLDVGSKCDSLLLEWTLARELVDKGKLRSVIPIILNSIEEKSFPAVAVTSVQEKIGFYLKKIPTVEATSTSQERSPLPNENMSVREVLSYMKSVQGISMTGRSTKTKTLKTEIANLLRNNVIVNRKVPPEEVDRQRIRKLEVANEQLEMKLLTYISKFGELPPSASATPRNSCADDKNVVPPLVTTDAPAQLSSSVTWSYEEDKDLSK